MLEKKQHRRSHNKASFPLACKDPGEQQPVDPVYLVYIELGGGFKYFLFSPLFGEDSHLDWYFLNGLKPPTRRR